MVSQKKNEKWDSLCHYWGQDAFGAGSRQCGDSGASLIISCQVKLCVIGLIFNVANEVVFFQIIF